jgi:hypothetical protein
MLFNSDKPVFKGQASIANLTAPSKRGRAPGSPLLNLSGYIGYTGYNISKALLLLHINVPAFENDLYPPTLIGYTAFAHGSCRKLATTR